MSAVKNGGKGGAGLSFPMDYPDESEKHQGISLRDFFAAQSLTGLMMSQWGKNSYAEFAKKSYAAADAMIEARKEGK